MRNSLSMIVLASGVVAGVASPAPAAPPAEERVLVDAGGQAFYSPDGNWIAVANVGAGKSFLVEARSPWATKRVTGPFRYPATFTPDSKFLVFVGDKQTLLFANVTTGKVERTVPVKQMYENNLISAVAMSGDGKHIATNTAEVHARVFDGEGMNPVDLENCFAHKLFFRPDGKAVMGGDGDGRICTWDVVTGKRQQAWQVVEKKKGWHGFDKCIFSTDGKLGVAVESDTDRVHLWDMEAGKEMGLVRMKGTFLCCMALSHDGKTLAVACRPKKAKPVVQLWDMASQKELDGIPELPAHVWELSFSPDGKHLVVAVDEAPKSKVKQATRLFAIP